jgi:uncharacterized delta-60 repeat protein
MSARPTDHRPLFLEDLEPRETPAAAGVLDPTFGTGGYSADLGGPAAAVAVDAAGRMIVAGSVAGPGGHDFLVTRLNPDGTPDTTFGTGGEVAIDFGGADDTAAAVALDTTGRIVVAGTTTAGGGEFAVARLTSAGALDPAFGGGQTAFHIAAGASDTATGVAVDPADNGVLVGGYTTTAGIGRFAAARLTSAGALDGGFGTGGVTSFTIRGADTERAHAIAVDSARRVVLAGHTFGGAPITIQAAAARLTPGGVLDPTFAGTGVTTIPLMDVANAVAVDGAGNVYAAGSQLTVSTRLVVAKLTAAGTPDGTFGIGGSVFIQGNLPGIGANSFVGTGIVVQPDGKVVVTGTDASAEVLRLTPVGALDPQFDPGPNRPGIAPLLAIQTSTGVALAPDGKIVAVGNTVGGVGKAARLLGAATAEDLAASGAATGKAVVYTTDLATGLLGTTPATTPAPFPGYTGPVRVATADVNKDGAEDTILITGPGTPVRFAVISGADHTTLLVPPTAPFDPAFTGGGFVSAGDFDRDGRAEMVFTPDQGGGPNVVIFSLKADGTLGTPKAFFALGNPAFRGGARSAVGDIDGDGVPDLAVGAGFLGGPVVEIHNGTAVAAGDFATLIGSGFFAFNGADAATLRNGVFLAIGNVNGDAYGDLVVGGGPGGGPRVLIFSGAALRDMANADIYASPLANFFVAGDSADRGGVRVAAKDLDNDGKAEVITGSGEGLPSRVRVYPGANVTPGGEPPGFQDLDPFAATLAGGVFVG